MGLDDIYYRKPYAPAADTNALITEGLGSAANAYQQYQQSYSPEFKEHLQRVLEGGEDPVQVARELKTKMGGGQQQQQQQQQPPLAMQPSAPPMDRGFAVQMPQPNSVETDYLAQLATPSKGLGSFGPYDRNTMPQSNVTGMEVPVRSSMPSPSPAEAFAPQQAPQAAPTPFIRTNADVQGAMGLMPYMRARPRSGTGRDFMAEIRERGEQARKTEGVKQEGRVGLMDMRNAARQLEQAAQLAYQQDALDERSAHHIETIKLGYARLRAMERLLDKNIDYKRESGADEMLKTARTVVDSLTASEGQLIGSAFAGTPQGAEMLQNLHGTLEVWRARLNEYAAQPPPPQRMTTTRSTQTRGAQSGGQQGAQKSRKPFAQRVQELKSQGVSKEQAAKTLAAEGYDLDKGM